MRFSLPSFILLALALTSKSFACVQFSGVVAVGFNDQQYVYATLVDNGDQQCWTDTFVPASSSFIFLTCNSGYYSTFQWDIWGVQQEVWYNTPWVSGGSFGLNDVGSQDGTIEENGVTYEALFITYSADVWGC
jgi:hypothetical protein